MSEEQIKAPGVIFTLPAEGRRVLGFDTGLNERDFGRLKAFQCIEETGSIVFPDGRVETWKPEGACLKETCLPERMLIYGPCFEGEALAEIITGEGREDEALAALGLWIRAGAILAGREGAPGPCPGGVLAGRGGEMLFLPEGLARRCLDGQGEKARLEGLERWVKPGLAGEEAWVFCACALLYRVFTGAPPFPGDDPVAVRERMGEGSFLPPALAAPGLRGDMAGAIAAGLSPQKPGGKKPSLRDIAEMLDHLKKKDFFKPLSEGDIHLFERKRKMYQKKLNLRIKTKSFIARRGGLVAGILGAAIIIALIAGNIAGARKNLPTTRGMSAEEVVRAFYGAFGNLDHELMSACVQGDAGKGDIEMVVSLFVTARVRQAYEGSGGVLPAEEWLAEGSPAPAGWVFGVTGLSLRRLPAASPEEERFLAEYCLWLPAPGGGDGPAGETAPPPQAQLRQDELTLRRNRKDGSWRITGIGRENSRRENSRREN